MDWSLTVGASLCGAMEELWRPDPRAAGASVPLVESQGAVISHNEALRRSMGEDVLVNGEAALYTAVKKIRR